MQGSLTQRFYERLSDQKTAMGGKLGNHQAMQLVNSTDPNDRKLIEMVASQIIEEEVSRMKTQAIPDAHLSEAYAQDAQRIKSSNSPESHYNTHVADVRDSAGKEGISLDTPVSAQHRDAAENRIKNQEQALQRGESSKQVTQQTTQRDVEEKQKVLHESMPTTVVKRGYDNVLEAITRKNNSENVFE